MNTFGTFLGHPFRSPVDVYTYQPEAVGETLTSKRVGVRRSVQRWRADFGVIDVRGERGVGGMLKWLAATRGTLQTFDFIWPQEIWTHAASGLTVVGEHLANESSILIAGITDDNDPGMMRYVTFAGHNKVYALGPQKDATGGKSVEIIPALTATVAAGAAVDTSADGSVQFITAPRVATARSIVVEATLTVQEVP